jgi:hypothetical protein
MIYHQHKLENKLNQNNQNAPPKIFLDVTKQLVKLLLIATKKFNHPPITMISIMNVFKNIHL